MNWIPFVLVAIATAIGLVTRFSRPELTETQLILEFWPQWLIVAGLAIIAVVINRSTHA